MNQTDNRATSRFRGSMALVIPVLTVALLVLTYRLTAPGRGLGGQAGAPVHPTDVLQVGALPVT